MSGQSITIPIIQPVINAIVSEETEITPRKIVELLGESYDKDSNYIFEIKENITIPTGKTLKDFENIVVNDTIIYNGGTIENCTITLNMSVEGLNKLNYNIFNGYIDFGGRKYGNIKKCNIISIGYSAISNGYGIIEWCNIILYSKSKLYNNKSNYGIKNCIITLNNVCEFYSYGLISDSYIFLYDSTEFLNHNNNTLYGILINTYIFVFDNCKISNTKNDSSGYFVNTFILKYSDDFDYDDTTLIEKIVDNPNEYKLNIPADTIVLFTSFIKLLINKLN